MPTVAIIGPYRFFFYASDEAEPPHIHVERESALAKFWIAPVRLQKSRGFSAVELRRIQRMIDQHRDDFHAKWLTFFAR
jgi:hypothetical protein